MKQDREAFITSYAREMAGMRPFSPTANSFDAGALEMVIRNTLSGFDEPAIRVLLPSIIDIADRIHVGLFVAAEIMTSDFIKNYAAYAEPALAEASKKLRDSLAAVPKSVTDPLKAEGARLLHSSRKRTVGSWWKRITHRK